jgi:hypothetical protein
LLASVQFLGEDALEDLTIGLGERLEVAQEVKAPCQLR